MKTIEAYQCADGSIHDDEKKAMAHDDDLLGAELDGLLKMFELDITRNQEYKALILVMKKRKELETTLASIVQILQHKE